MRLAPRRRPTATREVSSSMLRPTVETGRAFNHAPASLLTAARRHARYFASGALSSRMLEPSTKNPLGDHSSSCDGRRALMEV